MKRYEKLLKELRSKNPFLSNTELVYTLLRDDIVIHSIAPGQKLNQEQIATEMNVSRTPVRDAFMMLEDEGYLEKGVQGYKVYEMKPGDYVMLLDVRTALEKVAAKLACSRMLGSEREAIAKNIEHTESLMEQGFGHAWNMDFEVIDEEKAKRLFYELGCMDREFHRLIVEAAHNTYLLETCAHIAPRIHFFRFFALNARACQNMTERHKKIFEAILQRDDELAEKRMEAHLLLTIPSAIRC